MFCPICRAEFRAGFERCSDCHIFLVSERPAEREQQIEWRDPVTVFRGSDPTLIAVTTSFLEGGGIPFVVQNERSLNLLGAGLGTSFSSIVDVEIQVEAEYADAALELLANAEASLPHHLLFRDNDEPSDQPPFFPVAVGKLVFLSLATFGLYEIFWFYKNWRRVDDWTSNIFLPLGKALFAPAFGFRLFRAMRSAMDKRGVPGSFDPAGASLLYGFGTLSCLSTLPGSYWLLVFATAATLAWAQRSVNRLHLSIDPSFESDSRISLGNFACVGLCWLLVLGIASLSPVLLRGSDLPVEDRAMLISEGYLSTSEEVIYFYSATPWSFREHGSFFTDRRVVTYAREGDEYYHDNASYAEISDIQAWLEPSLGEVVVQVLTFGGSEIYLLAGNGENAQIFVDSLMQEWRLAPLRTR